MKQAVDIEDTSDVRNAIDTHREALIAQRDEINERIDRLDRAMAVIDGEDLVTPTKPRAPKLLPAASPGPRRGRPPGPVSDSCTIVLEQLCALGAESKGRWVACLDIVAKTGLRAAQVRGGLITCQKQGLAEPNGVKASGSRWRATKAGMKAPKTSASKLPKPVRAAGARLGGPAAEPRPGSVRAKVLAAIRATSADGMSRKAIESVFGLDAANQSAMVQGLLLRGFIRVEGPRGEQRIIATSPAPVPAAPSPAAPAPSPEVEADEETEKVEEFRAVDVEEPASDTTAGQMLAKLRKAGAKGMMRTTLETALEINAQSAATMVRMLGVKGLVRVEGEKADQRVFALRARPVEVAPAEETTPAYTSPEQPPPAPAPPPAPSSPAREDIPAHLVRKPIPVPRNPPPLVYPGAPGTKTAPPAAPTEPPPPATKAAPIAQRRVIKLELIREREDRFFCKPLTGSMDAGTCIDRQEIANSSPNGTSSHAQEQRKLKSKYMPTCASCKDGKKVASRVQEFS